MRINNKYAKVSDILFHDIYQHQLHDKDFSIISNNWFGGVLYEHFGLPKLSPTVGTYFFAKEYFKFISDLQYYIDQELMFIPSAQSRYAKALYLKQQTECPVGVLGDVEIVFLHYHTCQEAREKWYRRIERINWENLVVKFSEQNLCTKTDLFAFNATPFRKKILFTKNHMLV